VSDKSGIEWTDATWGPVTGCTRVSEGCDHCYIERTPPFRMAHRKFDGDGPGSSTDVILHSDRLAQPLRWAKPRRIFVNSMADLFHRDVPTAYVAKVFAVMAAARQHTFQLLTKRPGRMRSLLNSYAFREQVFTATILDTGETHGDYWPLPNLHLGVSVETQHWAHIRIPLLRSTPAAIRFISGEPLLGPLSLHRWLPNGRGEGARWNPRPSTLSDAAPTLDWVIAGGESGPGARPMHPDWARTLRDQCAAAGVPFLFKQWGEWAPRDGASSGQYPTMDRIGKKAAGRELDGRTWDEYPQAVPA
jgi:protein gp37